MYDSSFLRSASYLVATCMSSIDVHTGIFTDVLTGSMFMPMPVIS